MKERLYIPFLSALRLLQPNDKRGYLPPKIILTESIKNALLRDKELEKIWEREFYLLVNDWACSSPEVNGMIEDGLSSGIIWFPQIDGYSRPGYNYLINHRGASHLLRGADSQTEDVKRLALATHKELLSTIEQHLEFLKGRDCQTRDQALTIRRDLREVYEIAG